MQKKRDCSSKDLIELILNNFEFEGPNAVKNLRVRLNINEAEELCDRLNENNYSIQPYDFPGTIDVWESKNRNNIAYSIIAIAEKMESFAKRIQMTSIYNASSKVSFQTMQKLLPLLTQDELEQIPFNKWGTTLSGTLRHYNRSPSRLVLDLIENDDRYAAFRRTGCHPLYAYDFQTAPQNTWKDGNGNPTADSLKTTVLLLDTIAKREGIGLYQQNKIGKKRVCETAFCSLIPYLTADAFRYTPINEWGTTISKVLKVFGNSPAKAIQYVIDNHACFQGIECDKINYKNGTKISIK